jgi:hypothetical protein
VLDSSVLQLYAAAGWGVRAAATGERAAMGGRNCGLTGRCDCWPPGRRPFVASQDLTPFVASQDLTPNQTPQDLDAC